MTAVDKRVIVAFVTPCRILTVNWRSRMY